ncbi:pimeloyl-ACP methyl ester carboxylesterase [Conexibacter arvalis]|uniref:Pimeloyl-ACP methyl ester carboxylesterase n=2 Tax=Conexibacter arvalis TaxID=912552 RepID=A0A840IBU6_9ACTN|nr:alpha/beta hydrolase [Conexibacter arvalis]MBB4661805.1 pimeloyl-ACP methyl ester carboxylesterase [Conexibacter arvalis]
MTDTRSAAAAADLPPRRLVELPAVAIDLRGCGRSARPAAVEQCRMLAHVADNVALVRALGEERAVVIGHDVGATIAADSALLRPDLFTAVAMLGVPYAPRGGARPTELFARLGGEEEFYVSYFQQPGRAEAEIERDVRGWLAGFYAALSADTMGEAAGAHAFIAPGGEMRDRFPDGARPRWLSEEELDRDAAELERGGLAGPLARYRNIDRDWEDLAPWDGAPIRQPSLFVGGALDPSTTWMADAIAAFPATLPGLVASHLLDGCGHWLQRERPEQFNEILVDWLARLPAAGCGRSR